MKTRPLATSLCALLAAIAWLVRETGKTSEGGFLPPSEHPVLAEPREPASRTGVHDSSSSELSTPNSEIEEEPSAAPLPPPGSADHLNQLFNDAMQQSDPYAKARILDGLRAIQPADEQALELAASVLIVFSDVDIREAASAYVARFATANTVEALREFAAETPARSPSEASIAHTIRAISSPAAVEALAATLLDDRPKLREAAGIALAHTGTDAAFTALANFGGDPALPLELREAALYGLLTLAPATAESWLNRLPTPKSPAIENVLRRAATGDGER